jgi:hypothetical protein
LNPDFSASFGGTSDSESNLSLSLFLFHRERKTTATINPMMTRMGAITIPAIAPAGRPVVLEDCPAPTGRPVVWVPVGVVAGSTF